MCLGKPVPLGYCNEKKPEMIGMGWKPRSWSWNVDKRLRELENRLEKLERSAKKTERREYERKKASR